MVFDAFLRFRVPAGPPKDQGRPDQPHKQHPNPTPTPKQRTKPTLLNITELPPWYDPNPYIYTSYRPLTNSWPRSLHGWTYLHNETTNIFSHLIPAVILLFSHGWLYEYLHARHAHLTHFDWTVISVQLLSGVICLLASAVYHTGLNHSEGVAGRLLGCDYAGIMGCMVGCFGSGLHFGFYCCPGVKWFYWGVIVMLSSTNAVFLLNRRFSGPEWRRVRLAGFIGTGLSAFVPIAHVWVLWGPVYLWNVGVPYYLVEGLLLLIGCWFWETRYPESSYPGKFDIWGHSHTTWHIFVTLAIFAHIAGLLSAMDYTYSQGCLIPT